MSLSTTSTRLKYLQRWQHHHCHGQHVPLPNISLINDRPSLSLVHWRQACEVHFPQCQCQCNWGPKELSVSSVKHWETFRRAEAWKSSRIRFDNASPYFDFWEKLGEREIFPLCFSWFQRNGDPKLHRSRCIKGSMVILCPATSLVV